MSDNRIHRTKKKNKFLAGLITVCSAVIFSSLAAAIWQLATPEPEVLAPIEIDSSILSQFDEENIAVAVKASEAKVIAIPEPEEEEAESDDSQTSASDAAVESSDNTSESSEQFEEERVTSKYFDDAVFIGDSISVGIKLYEIMQNADVYASVGISLESIFTNPAVRLEDGSKVTIFQALEGKQYKKAYIMLGANSLMSGHEALIKQYAKVIDEVRARVGDECIIYIQSVLPVYEPVFHQKYPKNTTTNADINSFNAMLAEMTAQKGAHYLDVASAIKDENGSLPAEATSDGLHIGTDYYIKWFDYLKTHTVTE